MDIYTAINTRRTIRDFEDRPVEAKITEKLLDAGLKAPTNDHMRSWEFVIVNDKNIRLKLLEGIKQSVTGAETEAETLKYLESWGMTDKQQMDMYLDAIPKQQAMIYNAGCLILPFFREDEPILQPKSIHSLNEFASIWCCIENILLAAASEGIFGVTRIPDCNESENIKKVIGHPDNYVLPCYLALGYPAKNAKVISQKAVSVKDRIHFNSWSKTKEL